MGTLTDGFQIMTAEIIGTALLIILGDGVVAGVLLARSKAQNAGWIVITTGWALAVAVGVYAIGTLTGAHLNPAVTIGFAAIGLVGWELVPWYIVGEMIGALIGAVIVFLHYLPHWAQTEDPGLKLAVFSTGPAIRSTVPNLVSEIIGTFMLVFGVLGITSNELAPGFAALLVGFLVWAIGLSLGGPTGYAINPARDLGPRIAHAVLPIAGKGDSDWGYSWIPVAGPIIGGVLGAFAFQSFFTNFLMAA
jgi:glycerol uptake facilitator protein